MNFSSVVHEELQHTPFLTLVSQYSIWGGGVVIIMNENDTEGKCSRLGKTINYFSLLTYSMEQSPS